MLVVGRYAVAVLAWGGTAIIVRELTREEWGRFTLIFGLLGIIGLIADLRLSRIVLRGVIDAGDDAGELIGSYVTLRIVIGVASYVIAIAVVLLAYPRPVVEGMAVAGLNLITLSAAWGLLLLFEARFWLRSIASSQLLGQIGQLAVTIAIAAAGLASVVTFSWATVVSGAVMLGWLLWVLRHVTGIHLRVEPARWVAWFKEAAPLAVGSALGTIYFRIDIVMLSLLAGDRAVGTYGVGYRFSDLIGALPLAVTTPAMTLMVAAWPRDVSSFRRTFRHTFVLLTAGGVGVAVGFGVFAEPLIRTLYTGRYTGAVQSARLLVSGQALHFYTALCFVTLVSAGRNRLYPIATLLGVVVNVGLNFILIPPFSYNGSGWATLITEVAVLAVLGVGVMRLPALRPIPWKPVVKCAAAGLVAAGVGLALLHAVPWPLAAAATAGAYLVALHLLQIDGPGGLRVLAREGRIASTAGGIEPVSDLLLARVDPE